MWRPEGFESFDAARTAIATMIAVPPTSVAVAQGPAALVTAIKDLASLRDGGVLSETEFVTAKNEASLAVVL